MNLSFFLSLAAFRTRSRPCNAPSRFGVRSAPPCSAFPSVPPLAPPPPPRIAPLCSAASRLLWRSVTPRLRSSPATAPRLPDADRRGGEAARPDTRSPGSLNTESLCTCQGLRPRRTRRALAMTRPSVSPSAVSTASASGSNAFRGSMAGLCAPLPTLRAGPHGPTRTARGRCGSLLLHRSGLPPPTPCRSPGASGTTFSSLAPIGSSYINTLRIRRTLQL